MTSNDDWWDEDSPWDHYGRRLFDHKDKVEGLLGHLGRYAMDRCGIGEGESVLEIGCSWGDTSCELGRRVGPNGAVLGLDISELLLSRARHSALQAGLDHVELALVNIENEPLPRDDYDVIFSRFGVMWFDDPVAAFRRAREHLRPGGRLAFVCWQPLVMNTWIDLHLRTIAPLLGEDIRPPVDAHSGPFAFGDPERPRRILQEAGYHNIRVEPHTPALPLFEIRDLDELVEFSFVPLYAWIAMKARPVENDEARAAVRAAFAPYHTDRGVVLQSATWVVQADRGP